jgi:hypothetical protein
MPETTKEKQILKSSDEAATYKTDISGWVGGDGRFYGDNEDLARWAGCTHIECDECGSIKDKSSFCEPCSEKTRIEKFKALERKEWDGKKPLHLDGSDNYFFDLSDVRDYMSENNIPKVEDLELVICCAVPMKTLEDDYFTDDMGEGAELPEAVTELIRKINEEIYASPTISWEPDNYAAIVTL